MPTAQASLRDKAVTALSPPRPSTPGSSRAVHDDPFQCSISPPWPCRSEYPPTAQASQTDSTLTPVSQLLTASCGSPAGRLRHGCAAACTGPAATTPAPRTSTPATIPIRTPRLRMTQSPSPSQALPREPRLSGHPLEPARPTSCNYLTRAARVG